jgi:hypothetical protein
VSDDRAGSGSAASTALVHLLLLVGAPRAVSGHRRPARCAASRICSSLRSKGGLRMGSPGGDHDEEGFELRVADCSCLVGNPMSSMTLANAPAL